MPLLVDTNSNSHSLKRRKQRHDVRGRAQLAATGKTLQVSLYQLMMPRPLVSQTVGKKLALLTLCYIECVFAREFLPALD